MNIGIDVDGTLIDIRRFMLERGEKYFRRKAADPDAFDVAQMFACTQEECNRFWKKNLLGYCLRVPVINGAAETITRLRADGHKIFIVTSRVYTTGEGMAGSLFRAMLKGWLKRRSIVYDGIAFCEDSGEDKLKHCGRFGIDVMIDDKPENIIMIAEKCAVIAHPMPWNRHLSSQGYTVAKDWADIYSIVTGMKTPPL